MAQPKARSKILLLITAVATVVAIPVAMVATQRSSNHRQPAVSYAEKGVGDWRGHLLRRAAHDKSRAGQVGPDLFQAMGSPSSVPPHLRRRMLSSLGPGKDKLGLNFNRAYHLETALSVDIWVVSGRKLTCLFNGHTFAVACDTSSRVSRYGLVSVSGPSPFTHRRPAVVALGIVPDGIRTVQLEVLGSRHLSVPVVGNTFSLLAHGPIAVKGVSG